MYNLYLLSPLCFIISISNFHNKSINICSCHINQNYFQLNEPVIWLHQDIFSVPYVVLKNIERKYGSSIMSSVTLTVLNLPFHLPQHVALILILAKWLLHLQASCLCSNLEDEAKEKGNRQEIQMHVIVLPTLTSQK